MLINSLIISKASIFHWLDLLNLIKVIYYHFSIIQSIFYSQHLRLENFQDFIFFLSFLEMLFVIFHFQQLAKQLEFRISKFLFSNFLTFPYYLSTFQLIFRFQLLATKQYFPIKLPLSSKANNWLSKVQILLSFPDSYVSLN